MGKCIRVIDWNICLNGNIKKKLQFLNTYINYEVPTIIVLQEVTRESYIFIKDNIKHLSSNYSLEFRPIGKYERKNRALGVCILYTKDFKVKSTKLIERLPLPERSLHSTLLLQDKVIDIIGFHSVTGCDYGKTKTAQFLTMADYIEENKIDLVCFDANEPEKDFGDVYKNKYFYQGSDKDVGARTFFEVMFNKSLVDSFKPNDYSKEPLVVSHIIRGKNNIKRRYDYIYCNKQYVINKMDYFYEESIKAGSDHAVLIADIIIN